MNKDDYNNLITDFKQDKLDYNDFQNPIIQKYIVNNKTGNYSISEMYLIASCMAGANIYKLPTKRLSTDLEISFNKCVNKEINMYLRNTKKKLDYKYRIKITHDIYDLEGFNSIIKKFPKEIINKTHPLDRCSNTIYKIRQIRNIMEHRYLNITNKHDSDKKYEVAYIISNGYLRYLSMCLLKYCRDIIMLSLSVLKQYPFNFK